MAHEEIRRVYVNSIAKNGSTYEISKAISEMAEMIGKLSFALHDNCGPSNIAEGVAAVTIMMEILTEMYNIGFSVEVNRALFLDRMREDLIHRNRDNSERNE